MSYREGIDLTPGGFLYRQAPHRYCGSNADRQSVGDPGHCEDCCSVGHVVAHPDLGCADVGCYADHEVTSASGDLADEPPVDDGGVVDMRQVLPSETLRELTAGAGAVLELAQARGAGVQRQGAWVAAWVAPLLAAHRVEVVEVQRAAELAGLRLQLEQAGATLEKVLATSTRVRARLAWLGEIAHTRAVVAHRLRTALWSALADAERFRALTPQSCPAGLHDGWLVESEHQYACPWCQIVELRAAAPKAAGLAQHLHRLADALGVLGAEEDIDPYQAVRDLHSEVDRLRDEVAGQPGYADRHRGCVTIGGGYCVDRHDDENPVDDSERCPAGDPECDSEIVHDGCRTPVDGAS